MDRAHLRIVSLRFRPRRSLVALLAIGCLAAPARAQEYNFMHFAGSVGGPGAYDSSGINARFNRPFGITIDDATGILYVTDAFSSTVRAIKPGGAVTTFAGMAGGGFAPEGSPRGAARFSNPQHLTRDGAGNLYVAEGSGSRIRKITPTGVVTTLAGAGWGGSADGTGTAAEFASPDGIAYHPGLGALFVADTGNHTIRKVTLAGVVTTFAGTAGMFGSTNGVGAAARFNSPSGIAVDPAGNIWVADTGNHTIRRITTGGSVTTVAGLAGSSGYANGTGSTARFAQPYGIAFDAAGVAHVADTYNNRIRRVTAAGAVTTLAGGAAGDWVDGTGSAAAFAHPTGIVVSSGGDAYVTDAATHVVRKVTAAGVVTTLAGAAAQSGAVNATGLNARFYSPRGMAVDAAGNLFVADEYNRAVRKVAPDGVVTTFAGTMGSAGTVDGTGSAARFFSPFAMAIDGAGNLYLTDRDVNTIRKITPAGVVTTFAGTPGAGGSADGTGAAASFSYPEGIAVDGSGNVYVADTWNHTIRKITPARVVTTFAGTADSSGSANGTGAAARFNYPRGLACDASDNLYVADSNNQTVRKITPAGVVTTLAGTAGVGGIDDGTGAAARFSSPEALVVAASGTIYLAEFQSPRIRKITPAGVVTTLAGHVGLWGSEPGTGPVARFVRPGGLAISGDTLFYSDVYVHSIKRGLPAFGTVATIDDASAPIGEARQLEASPDPGNTRFWALIRKPALSTAGITFPQATSFTFTPDVPDTYVFRLVAHGSTASSITTVTLNAECWTLGVAPSSLPEGLRSSAYSQTLTASGGTGTPVFSVSGGALPPGMTLSAGGAVSGTPTSAGEFNFTARATDQWGCFGERSYTLTIRALPAPTGLVATGGSTSVALTWNAVSGAATYEIYRRAAGSGLVYHGSSASPSYTDSWSVSPNAAYLYVVQARDAASYLSANSNADLATTVAFTDPALTAGSTPIKAVHMTQLRTAVNAARAVAGLAPASFTDPTLSSGVTIKAVHLTQLRSNLNTARSVLGLPAVSFTDASPAGVQVKAVHIQQVRSGVE